MWKLLFALSLAVSLYGQAEPIASYQISARLDPEKKTVEGSETIVWKNDSPDAVQELRFHLYMNAFKNQKSTWMRESGGQMRSDNRKKDSWGFIDVRKMEMVGGEDLTKRIQFISPDDGNPDDRTVIRVPLAAAVAPGQQVKINVSFLTQLPHVFARTGFHGNFFLGGQWFPKLGVFEKAGMRYATTGQWNCHQFHATTEFYADFGTYDVKLTVPSEYVVGATGVMTGQQVEASGKHTTYSFYQENVHDFAWTAQPAFKKYERMFQASAEVSDKELDEIVRRLGVTREEAKLSDVKMILLLQPEHESQKERHFKALANAIKYFGLWYGRYPHATITLVDPPHGGGGAGGMEYPTFITGGTNWLVSPAETNPEEVIVHEFGHQFWQGLVASNEFEEAWMDEGFNTYSTGKVIDHAYGPGALPLRFGGMPWSWFIKTPTLDSDTVNRAAYLFAAKSDTLWRYAWQYQNSTSYGVNSYMRTGVMLRTLENLLGQDTMGRVMRTYQQRWRFRHPSAPDFIKVVNEVGGKDMTWFFDQALYGSNVLDYRVAEVSCEPEKTAEGIFGDGGKKSTITKKEAETADEKIKKEQRVYRTKITIRREGEFIAPVDTKIVFENGEVLREKWDGQYRWVKYEYLRKSKLKSVEVDPERKLLLDINFTNNSHTDLPRVDTAAKWTSSLLFWVQNILLLASSVN